MSDSGPWRQPDVMGGRDNTADVLEGGEEPPGENPDLMEDRPQRPSDIMEGGREPEGEDPDVMSGGREPAGTDPDIMAPPGK